MVGKKIASRRARFKQQGQYPYLFGKDFDLSGEKKCTCKSVKLCLCRGILWKCLPIVMWPSLQEPPPGSERWSFQSSQLIFSGGENRKHKGPPKNLVNGPGKSWRRKGCDSFGDYTPPVLIGNVVFISIPHWFAMVSNMKEPHSFGKVPFVKFGPANQ